MNKNFVGAPKTTKILVLKKFRLSDLIKDDNMLACNYHSKVTSYLLITYAFATQILEMLNSNISQA